MKIKKDNEPQVKRILFIYKYATKITKMKLQNNNNEAIKQ